MARASASFGLEPSDSTDPAIGPSVGAAARGNPLANKIVSVLSASYADLDIREALDALDRRQVQNNAQTRRQLRLEIQREVIDCNGEIVDQFGEVARQLRTVGATIARLNRCCEQLRGHVAAVQHDTAPVLSEASAYLAQREQTQTKQCLLDAFHAHFSLSEAELQTLTVAAEPVDEAFFGLLGRLRRMHQDCQVLLGSEDHTLGLAIMEQSSRQLNAAFQKLYLWVQAEFKTINLENPQISSPIRRALRVLAERPSLFQGCLDFFSTTREHILSDAFHAALTGAADGAADGDAVAAAAAKPIEMYAHDPLRYVGDMLAWVHSAAVSEREALEVLFVSDGDDLAKTVQAGRERDPWSRATDDDDTVGGAFDGRQALSDLVNRDLVGVGRMLRQRVEQLIQSQDEPTLAYRVGTLVNFYRITFSKLLGPASSVVDTLAGLEASAQRQFRATVKDQTAALEVELPSTPPLLVIPDFLDEALQQLRVLLTSFDSSMASAQDRQTDFQSVLDHALTPFLRLVEAMAQGQDEPARDIFLLNCYTASRDTLSPHDFAAVRVRELEHQIELCRHHLVQHQHGYFLQKSGLDALLIPLASLPDSDDGLERMGSLPAFQPRELQEISQVLDDFLPSALIDATERVKRLQDSSVSHSITQDAAGLLCEDFDLIEARIIAFDALQDSRRADHVDGEDASDAASTGHRLRPYFPRTGAELRVLLS